MKTPALLVWLLASIGPAVGMGHASSSNLATAVSAPLVVSDARQFDFKSTMNDREYRLFIATPPGFDASKSYPVLYILDANYYFAAARDIMHYLGSLSRPSLGPAILVGIGYPTTAKEAMTRRVYDLSPRKSGRTDSPPSGGGEEFVRLLLEDVKPFVAARFKVDGQRQTIFGKSMGGLMVLHLMMRHPTAFTSYVAASPAIAPDEGFLLKDLVPFAERSKGSDLNIRLLVTVGGAETKVMIANSAEFVKNLQALDLKGVTATHVSFPDEDHSSVSLSSLGRALYLALPAPVDGAKPPTN
ncbi:MAG: Ferri-bacillibactin esterase BesA [Verrucomicrobiota bacterium]|jgi:predicted alpha/beta superfamily hydrolase